MTREATLARTLVHLADTLVADFDLVELLTYVAGQCVDVLEVDATGIVLASPSGELRPMAASSEQRPLLELVTLLTDEGPGVDCYRAGTPVLAPDVGAAPVRWPRLAAAATAAGYRSLHALPMRLRGTIIGALVLLRTEPSAMPEADLVAAQAFADMATIAILQHRAASDALAINQQLSAALTSRIVIEQAKGMVAERLDTSVTTAFEVLRLHARTHNLRLADVARDVIERRLAAEDLDRAH